MEIFIRKLVLVLTLVVITTTVHSCFLKKKKPTSTNPGDESGATGAGYNSKDGFELADFKGQDECPGLVYIEGGKTTLGAIKEDFLYNMDNIERTVTVQSFYMDETEVANVHWLEYLYHVKQDSSEESYLAALPDTLVWSNALAFNDAYVDYYFRYAGFRFYPVVGVTWKQVVSFCEWRTSTVEAVLSGDIKPHYVGGGPTFGYGDTLKNKYKNSPKKKESKKSNNPPYRLPTEDEWEYAALAIIDVWTRDEASQKRIYPWDGHKIRNPYNKKCGTFLANFKRGRGDYAGIAGKMNDGAMITDYIYAYPPNDFGLYNMAGNVNEWVYDKYKPRLQEKFFAGDPSLEEGSATGSGEDEEEEYYTLLGPNVRVYKGGSWKDVAYWLSPGTRRYLEEDSSTATIGFRCAMDKLGGKDK